MSKIRKYLAGVKKEIERVRWPNKQEMAKYSLATVFFIVFFAGMFYLLDLFITFLRAL